MAKLEITLVRSVIGRSEKQRTTVKTLGLRKLNHSVVQNDNAAMRGMIKQVQHLVSVKEIEG
ncbi:50S ribosomal protein L30 [Paenibacillus sp. PsM32]|uniref:Large ribosomal subunit protein uL30 n=2 Tax=Paenibacillus TaxID=44249 RepID=A0ABW4UNV7_9BACL|nr:MULTISPECIES: 50S ribosomal protein L30 [Paenibacillus]MDN4620731.1 50S ribosomal protein L30 [Paenibacillus sp. PsM32]MDQ1235745.1 large subunit ribosomal protein L30 [Paenibacillus sp. SORGH_AS_0306]MDR6112794.1 large subunit ribosomal protein L30 [Paenibacillus sp. SORGH_AS_0338]WCT55241.1 50S ribosomal protein L30 [Paenibacillus kyungheensis]WDF51599.1 50S ribosomal protein L30 [Paenibacillus sp. KACC 21273]